MKRWEENIDEADIKFDETHRGAYYRHSVVSDFGWRRVDRPYIKEQQKAMSFIVDPDARELIITQGLPGTIPPQFMRLPYDEMYLDVRLPLPSGKFLEGIFLYQIDDSEYEAYREGGDKSGVVAVNMTTGETGVFAEFNGGTTAVSITDDIEDIRRRWHIRWVETDGAKRSSFSDDLEVSTWGDDPVFPVRPYKGGDTKDYRAVVDFIIGLLLFIQLPDVELVNAGHKGSAKSIKKREARREREGLPPLPERRVIQLSGEVKRYVNLIASGEGSGKRFHHVRGHFRTYRHERYKEKKGTVGWVPTHTRGWGTDIAQEYEVMK